MTNNLQGLTCALEPWCCLLPFQHVHCGRRLSPLPQLRGAQHISTTEKSPEEDGREGSERAQPLRGALEE